MKNSNLNKDQLPVLNMNEVYSLHDDQVSTIIQPWKVAEARQKKWDGRFLIIAKDVATWSKDPSTQVGSVLVRPNLTLASVGFNGFPRKMEDKNYDDREYKYSRIIHAEMNAIAHCKEDLTGYTLYSTLQPCDRCAVLIAQEGISRVVSIKDDNPRWQEAFEKSIDIFKDCGVELVLY